MKGGIDALLVQNTKVRTCECKQHDCNLVTNYVTLWQMHWFQALLMDEHCKLRVGYLGRHGC